MPIQSQRHVALFGGTFNPVHFGHLVAAKNAADHCDIHRVYLIPSYLPPHRELEGSTSAIHRLEMVRLACDYDSRFRASDVEIRRPGPSYSYDTVMHFLKKEPDRTRISFLIGTDAFALIDTWHRVQDLLTLCDFLVMIRPGAQTDLTESLPDSLRSQFDDINPNLAIHASGNKCRLIPIDGLKISSTAVRAEVKNGGSLEKLIPKTVEMYIAQHGLYRQ